MLSKFSERDVQAMKNKYRLWTILHSGEKRLPGTRVLYYCLHCKYHVNDGCISMHNGSDFAQLGFCYMFLMEGNYVK